MLLPTLEGAQNPWIEYVLPAAAILISIISIVVAIVAGLRSRPSKG